MWKVYNIHSKKMVKGGLKNEDAADEWLEAHPKYDEDDYVIEEMNEEEQEDWLEEHGLIDRDDSINYQDEEDEFLDPDAGILSGSVDDDGPDDE